MIDIQVAVRAPLTQSFLRIGDISYDDNSY